MAFDASALPSETPRATIAPATKLLIRKLTLENMLPLSNSKEINSKVANVNSTCGKVPRVSGDACADGAVETTSMSPILRFSSAFA